MARAVHASGWLVAPMVALLLAGCGAAPSTAPSVEVSPPSVGSSSAMVVTPPPANAVVDYQLGGAYEPAPAVQVVTRDRTVAPDPMRYSICYVNAFQTQPEEAAGWRHAHPELVLTRNGRPVEDPDWPGEYLLDLSTAAKRAKLITIVGAWFDGCARDGYRAVEPDNLDSWTRSHGLLSQQDNVAFARLLAARAHDHGLAIAQKNTTELAPIGPKIGFDFAVVEECQAYAECPDFAAAYGDRVIEIEYTDEPARFYTEACRFRGDQWSIMRRDRDVVPAGADGYYFEHC